jgi:hypothetical protein
MILREAVGWLSVIVALAGAGVCAAQLGRVRFAGVLMGGFALQALVSAFYRVFSLLALRGSASGLTAGLAAVSLVGLLGSAIVVAGVAGLLAELRRAGDAR